ncbi:MAG TPA: thioredoxin-disulfide reductase [Firmicutes bacterium]|nr:thioredoxin-disulfide reductase [Bacillota bacterium]
MVEEVYDVAIIGGGPAGMTAGIYAGRAHLKACILEGMSTGGQMFTTAVIENYPGYDSIDGPALTQAMEEQVRRWDVKILYMHVTGLKRQADLFAIEVLSGETIHAKTVIAAAGSKPRRLGVPGENEFQGRGVSYCATCDGAFFRGKSVAVVGGGDSAVEEGLYLTRFVDKVTIIHRRDQLRASRHLQERAFANPKIEFIWDSVVEAIEGHQAVEQLRVKNVKTGAVTTLPADGVFIYVGMLPNSEFLQGVVELDPWGYVVAGEDTVTSEPGIFAAGDIRTKSLRQIVTAVADGAVAAMAAEKYLGERGL